MNTSGHVDWLAVTFPATVLPNHTMPRVLNAFTWVKHGNGSNGYAQRFRNDLGMTLLTDGEERMGIHVVMPGESLATARSMGVTDRALCEHVITQEGKLSRLDVAVDIFEGKLTAGEMAIAYAEGRLKTPAKGARHLKEILAPNEVLYIGSRSSDRFFRAYNKAAQTGVDDMAWLRLELELKKTRANGVALAITHEDNTRVVINRAIGDFVAMSDSDELTNALNDKSGPLPEEGRKLHNTYRWLMEQVAPAMARYQAEHMDENVWEAMRAVYTQELNKLIGPNAEGEHEV